MDSATSQDNAEKLINLANEPAVKAVATKVAAHMPAATKTAFSKTFTVGAQKIGGALEASGLVTAGAGTAVGEAVTGAAEVIATGLRTVEGVMNGAKSGGFIGAAREGFAGFAGGVAVTVAGLVPGADTTSLLGAEHNVPLLIGDKVESFLKGKKKDDVSMQPVAMGDMPVADSTPKMPKGAKGAMRA